MHPTDDLNRIKLTLKRLSLVNFSIIRSLVRLWFNHKPSFLLQVLSMPGWLSSRGQAPTDTCMWAHISYGLHRPLARHPHHLPTLPPFPHCSCQNSGWTAHYPSRNTSWNFPRTNTAWYTSLPAQEWKWKSCSYHHHGSRGRKLWMWWLWDWNQRCKEWEWEAWSVGTMDQVIGNL